jgi:short-subunit dehydrogenase
MATEALLGISPDAFSLRGQVALITGASRNIGAAIAASFASAGADLMLVARGALQLEETAELIRRQAPQRRTETAIADVGAGEDVDRPSGGSPSYGAERLGG